MADRVLVTGGSGYLGGWVVARLLQSGYEVRTTVRSAAKADTLRSSISAQTPKARDPQQLEIVVADLERDDGWRGAAQDCRFVQHVASPFPAQQPSDPEVLIRPAREGALRVLRAAVAAGVERVVLTSSVVAVSYGYPDARYDTHVPFTAADWTDPNGPGVTAYGQSKTLAERAARDFMAEQDGRTGLVTVNPSGIFGPTLGTDLGTSLIIIQRLLKGAMPGLPRLGFQIVDVRDAADLHLLAMTKGEADGRYVASNEFLWLAEVAELLRTQTPGDLGRRVPTRNLPDWALRIVAMFDPQARSIVHEVGRRREVTADSSRALGWRPRPAVETLVASATSLQDVGAI